MVDVTYAHEFPYRYDPVTNDPFPLLQLRLSRPDQDLENAIDIDAYLDSGAQRSVLEGWMAPALGLDLMDGEPVTYSSTTGQELQGRLHEVRLSHPLLGAFHLEIGFATSDIARNLLGRDFFNLIQLGFRERQLVFYVTPSP